MVAALLLAAALSAETGRLERQGPAWKVSGRPLAWAGVSEEHLKFLAGQWVRVPDGPLKGSPTLLSGPETLSGKLTAKGLETYGALIPVRFYKPSPVLGTSFDEKTRAWFEGKHVTAQGRSQDGVFTARAIIPAGLLAARDPQELGESRLLRQLAHLDPWGFTRKTLWKPWLHRKPRAFRYILWKAQGAWLTPGTPALVLTLSGRQGDSPGAAAGHLAAGAAVVGEDGSLKGELFNVYYPNDKGVKSANTDLVSYFGDLQTGQNQFRPTVTAILYGFDAKRLEKLRALADDYHRYLREQKPDYGLRSNCTTATLGLLDEVDVYSADRRTFGPGELRKLEALMASPVPYLRDLAQLRAYPVSQYLPRAAFMAVLENAAAVSRSNGLGIKAIEIVYMGQFPSARPTGGSPIDEVRELPVLASPTAKILSTID